MNNVNSIGDEEFIPFLHNLGVDTYNKAFEWMLSDPEFGDVLRWIYNNLDQNTALSAREECRYAELEKRANILSSDDLEAALSAIQQEYPKITLPGDLEALEDLKSNINMYNERLNILEDHQKVIKDLVTQNEVIKLELDKELIKLNAAQRQCDEDEAVAAQESLQLAEEVDYITNSVVDVVTDTLYVFSNCCKDKEVAKRFLTFGSFDTYKQSQVLFRSHFDLYTTKKFEKRNDDATGDDLRAALVEARSMEERLLKAICGYIESKTELSGEQAKLTLVSNYNNVHPSQIASCIMEVQSSLDVLEQEESILQQQLSNTAKELVDRRTGLAVDVATNSALLVREQISKDLMFLLEVTQEALAQDRLVYCALRYELRGLEVLLNFASHLRMYITEERTTVIGRIQSMNDIKTEHEIAERAIHKSDGLVDALCYVLNVEFKDALILVQKYSDLLKRMRELRDTVVEGFGDRERALEEFQKCYNPLTSYVFDGCTKRANRCDKSLAIMAHTLRTEVDKVDQIVLEASGMFQAVKNGDKRNLRKLWQWFLTDPARLFTAMKHV